MERTFKQLDFIIRQTDEIAMRYDKQKMNDVSLFCMCMLDRLNFGAASLKSLLEKVVNKPQLDFGCGVIIRSLLLDYLIVLNAFEIFERSLSNAENLEKELSDYCLMMLCDSVRNTLEYFDSLDGSIPDDLLNKMYTNLIASNPNCFERSIRSGERPIIKTKNFKSPKKLLQTLMQSKALKQFRWVYTAYLYYSKYDHFGNIYYGLSRQDKQQQNVVLKMAIDALPQSLLVVSSVLTSVEGEKSWIFYKRQELASFIENNKEGETGHRGN